VGLKAQLLNLGPAEEGLCPYHSSSDASRAP
jgi:hypothetical protein